MGYMKILKTSSYFSRFQVRATILLVSGSLVMR